MNDRQPDLVADLMYLRKDAGCTRERFANAGAVIDVVGGRGLPLETAFERFRSAVYSLKDIPQGPALWAAYNLTGEASGDLGDRRVVYGKSIGRKLDAVRDWESRAIDVLALRLTSRFYAGAPTPADFPVPHGGFLIRDLEVVCIIKDRRFVESRQRRAVISLVEGEATFDYGTYSSTELSDVVGAELEFSRRLPGGTIHRLKLQDPAAIGELHQFSFRERVPEGEEDHQTAPGIDFSGQTFESPTLAYRVGVQFIGEQPEIVWGYDKLSRIARPGEPDGGILIPVEDGKVSAEFFQCYGGLASGVAWRWCG
ncbi:hypothetical protein ABZU53_11145 [Micromonospora sp. NPDC005194]|uniref:hypothetical protein n=1 Tax=Micromonospora sp. NPDC005194 TaxID=3156870 RepID=UPI0033A28A73